MVTRRQLLAILTGSAAALIVPEILVPKRTFFLPPPQGWHSPNGWRSGIDWGHRFGFDPDTVLTVPTDLNEAALERLVNQLRANEELTQHPNFLLRRDARLLPGHWTLRSRLT